VLIVNEFGGDSGSVEDLSNSFDQLCGVDCGELTYELAVAHVTVFVDVQVVEHGLELLFFKSHMETSHFLLELTSGELTVRI
jgi:hypothetical protein